MLGNESILAVDYRIDGDTLYRYHSRAVERIVPWGPDADARRMTAGVWEPLIPEVDVSSLEENAWHPGPTRWPGWRRRVAACSFLVEHWPEEARNGVRSFPSAHWQLLQFVNAGGAPALELLHSNPALGYLAALAGAAGQIRLRRRSLAALFGFPETEHAVRLLRKVPTAWVSCEFLAQLRTAMTCERDAEAVLTHLARINPIALELARDPELRASVAPDCITRLSRLPSSVSHSDLIARIRDLRENAHGQALPHLRIRAIADIDRQVFAARVRAPRARPHPTQPAEPFAFPAPSLHNLAVPGTPPPPPIRTFADLDRPVCAAQVRVPPAQPRPKLRSGSLAFPSPPIPDLAAQGVQILAIRSQPDLVVESNVMHHCAGRDRSYARRVVAGNLYFYRMLEPERLTIAIRAAGCGWVVEEIRGFCNRQPSDHCRFLIVNWTWQASESPGETTPAEPAPVARPLPAVLQHVIPPRRRPFTPANQLPFDFIAADG